MKKSRTLLVLMCIFISLTMLCGCGKKEETKKVNDSVGLKKVEEKEEEKVTLPEGVFPLQMNFSSGAGGWATNITIKEDGSFVGRYSDSEMGSTGEDYDGTVYICEFSGIFRILKKINKYSYSLHLVEIITDRETDTEWVEDRVKYIYSTPFGLEKGTEFILYTPETPVSVLPEQLLSWWPHRFTNETERPETLSCYGLHNVKNNYGFFSME